jgi:hypothetical protein
VNRETPPQPDELEISVIGPGRGECVLIHLGNNEWCVVDSCFPRDFQEPVALEYLKSFQNDAASRIRLVVATHWHDDHVRGLSGILRASPQARFACSAALKTEIFMRLVAQSELALSGRSGVEEFASIYKLLLERADQSMPSDLVCPMYASENRQLLSLHGLERVFPIRLTSLSPADGAITLAYRQIAKLIPSAGDPQRRILSQDPNHTSIAMWVEAGLRHVLLGADLENTERPGDGWIAVVSSFQQTGRAAIFKVPHHGSANGHCDEVWEKLLTQDPIAVVTPFPGAVALPKKSDVTRLCSLTSEVYCTIEGVGKPPRRDASVERQIKQVAKKRRILQGRAGHVRIRWSATDAAAMPVVDLFHGARHACSKTV